MINDDGQLSDDAVLARQAAILIRGVRPSYGWLAGVSPPSVDVFDDARTLGWQVGCRMLSHRLTTRLAADSGHDEFVEHLADWVRFELDVDTARWRQIRPVAILGADVFENLVTCDESAAAVIDGWTTTLQWCLARCSTGEMKVDLDDLWLLACWRDRAASTRGGLDVAELLSRVSRFASERRHQQATAPFLRTEDASLVQRLLEHQLV